MAGADGYIATDNIGQNGLDDIPTDPGLSVFDLDQLQLPFALPSNYFAVVLDDFLSCRGQLWVDQRRAINLGLGGVGVFGLYQPSLLLSGLTSLLWVVFSCLIIWRLVLIVLGLGLRLKPPRNPAALMPQEADWPIYSLLVPVFHETKIMQQLATAMNQLVWPADRLDIQILFEADDVRTLAVADISAFPPGTRFTIIPPGGLRTKANALNYGLTWARGEYVCIYDAEDRPHPGQLLEAYRSFRVGGADLVCVQAPLVGDNCGRARIAAHWNLEYATQFGLLMPAMAALGLPMPIGGTSNHFRKDALLGIGGWDAWNVTEDADLGLRFARFGGRVATLNLPTFEDAPTRLSVWIAQRSRWIKGFIQTWTVLMRRPSVLRKQLGWRGFLAVQLALGGAILAPLFHAPMLLLVALACISSAISIGLPGTILLGCGLAVGILGDVLAPGRWSLARLGAVITRPLYWPLHSISAVRAIYELAVAPHFWAKTPHVPH